MSHGQTLTEELRIDSYTLDDDVWIKGRNIILFIVLATWVMSAFGIFTDRPRFLHSYLTAFWYFLSISLGALFFVMVQYLTSSIWSIPMRRFMESLASLIPMGALLFIPVILGLHDIYEWSNGSKDPVVAGKLGYLNPNFFLLRAVAYFGIWSLFSFGIFRQSVKQDRTNSFAQTLTSARMSAPGLLLTFLTVTLASFDWIMSLDPRWYSTIFGIYCFAGGGLCFMAVLTLICLAMRHMGILANTINGEHYHDLGKWMFALTVFWAYIAFSQYLLIWYANIPEETIFYKHRFEGSWGAVSVLLLIGHFIVPLLALISRPAKRSLTTLGVMAAWIAVMHYVDVYWLIMPNFSHGNVSLHWLDFATLGSVGSAMALIFWWRLRNRAIIPIGDLRLEAGLAFKNV